MKLNLKKRLISAAAAVCVMMSSLLSPINVYSEEEFDASAVCEDADAEDGENSDMPENGDSADNGDTVPFSQEEDIEAEITTACIDSTDIGIAPQRPAKKSSSSDTSTGCGSLTAFVENEYKITLTYDNSAGIPNGAELSVKEMQGDDYLSAAADALELTDDDYILYTRFFDISIIKDGVETEPLSPVTVTAELLDINEGAEALQVVHFDGDNAVQIESCTTSSAEVIFEADSFSVYGFSTVLHTVFTERSDIADITLYSTDDSVKFTEGSVFIDAPEEGIEPSRSFMLEKNTAEDTKLWVKAEPIENAVIPEGQSCALYSVCGGETGNVIIEDISKCDELTAVDSGSSGVALMIDTGYRRLNFELEPKEGATVVLDGLMPQNAQANVENVTDSCGADTIAAYDITILDGTDEYQPCKERPVSVTITDPAITEDADLQLRHIKDSGETELITDFTVQKGKITFDAEGFSVYEIVRGPDVYVPTLSHAETLADIISADGTEKGFYLSVSKGTAGAAYYFRNVINPSAKDGAVFYVTENNSIQNGSVWYFEPVSTEDNIYRVYTYLQDSPSVKNYILRDTTSATGNPIGLTPDPILAVEFKVIQRSSGLFYLKDNSAEKYFQFSNGGKGARFYNNTGDNNDDKNSRITLTYASSLAIPDDPYSLNGKTYGIMYPTTSGDVTIGQGLSVTPSNNATRLRSEELVVRINGYDHKSELYVTLSNNSAFAMFTFNSVGEDKYTLSTTVGETTKYLKLTVNGLSLTDEADASEITVIPGTGANSGKIKLSSDGINIAYSGSTFYANGNSSSWLNLVQPSDYQSDDFVIYSAEKVSVSNPNLTTGNEIIIYTRIWNEDKARYDFYAVDHDGSLVPCYERGNSIMWIGSKINTLLWEFTEYTYADGTPNYYYEFYNPYSDKYLAPQLAASESEEGQVLSDNTIGVNLPGRRNGGYYSQITAWDNPHYAFASLKAHGTDKIVSCHRFDNDTATFYFASMEPLAAQELTQIETVDNDEYGIKMRMIDFNGALVVNEGTTTTQEQHRVMGESKYDSTGAKLGMLQTGMTNGYPTAKLTGRSLSELFTNANPVNHLFIESTRKASGYFEYDSCQNFASLKGRNSGDFVVYKELASIEGSKVTYKHGQFLPFNDIDPELFITNENANPQNLYDAEQNILPESDPRKYEQLYKIADPDYYFGMELEAGFVQTPSGKDAWDHDIIFEFTGDDDFWLYVDGELVIDLGGIHSALPGNVNFRTGEVNVSNCTGNTTKINNIYNTIYKLHNDNPTDEELTAFRNMLNNPGGKSDPDPTTLTLKEIFAANFLSRYHQSHPTASEAEAYAAVCAFLGDYFEVDASATYGFENIFKDYSTHEMKIFYMERGGGASNLHMRFNLSDVKPGQVVLSKELTGSDDTDFSLVHYPYQIWYKPEGSTSEENDGYVLLGNVPASGGDAGEIYVTDPTSNAPVEFEPTYTIHDSANGDITYENVYFLNPGKKMAITFPSELIGYYIVECGINKEVYRKVYGNDAELTPTDTANIYYKDYAISKKSVKERPSVTIRNEVDPAALRTLSITKNLYSELVDENDVVYEGARDAAKDSRAAACLLSREDDNTEFSYRLYLGNSDSDASSLPYANMHKYHVKDANGNYCQWVMGIGFVSTGKKIYSQLTDTEKISATFETSMNGSISRIPAGYTVEVPDLLVGTKFKVIEKESEIPKGYKLMQYERIDGTYLLSEGDEPNSGIIRANSSPQMTIKNKRGWGLTADKLWSDDGYIGWHYPIYVAVYIKNGNTEELLDGTVREITKDSLSAYYYFDSIESGHTFDDYVVREVILDYPHYSSSGELIYSGTPTKIEDGAFTNVDVQQVNPSDTNVYHYEYSVSYEQGTAVGGQGAKPLDNVRTDIVQNTRSGGIMIDLGLYKALDPLTNTVETPLEGGKFRLTLYRTTDPEKTVYTQQASYDFVSKSNGIVTILYNFMRKTDTMDAYYILEEIQSPTGYVGISHPVKFDIEQINGIDVITLYDDENGDWKSLSSKTDDDDVLIAHLNIFNKPFNFCAVKFEAGNSANTLGRVVFALYKQVKGGDGTPVKDYRPIAGYEHLETDAQGVIDKINQNLKLGTYYLTELSPLEGFENLLGDIIFTVTDLGGISLISAPEGVELKESNDETGMKTLDLSIPNKKSASDVNLTIHKTVTGNMGDRSREFTFGFAVDGAVGTELYSWSKNGVSQTPIHSGETFTLKHDDTAVFIIENGKTITVTETAEGYETAFRKGSDTAVIGNEITFTVTDNTTLEVNNTLNVIVPTAIVYHTAAYTVLFMFAAAVLVVKRKKRSRKV